MKEMNLNIMASGLEEYFSPKIIGEVNDVFVKVVKIKGEKVPWHNHKEEDELFYVIEGSLLFETEDQDSFIMNEGDLFIVKRGVNHRVSSREECKLMLIENKVTKHTGDVTAEITRSVAEQRS